MEEKVVIGKRIKELRQSLGLNQKEFADKLGLDQGQVSRAENGGTGVNLNLALSINRAFDTPTDLILLGKNTDALQERSSDIARLKNELSKSNKEINNLRDKNQRLENDLKLAQESIANLSASLRHMASGK